MDGEPKRSRDPVLSGLLIGSVIGGAVGFLAGPTVPHFGWSPLIPMDGPVIMYGLLGFMVGGLVAVRRSLGEKP